jgi:hypothetical protein
LALFGILRAAPACCPAHPSGKPVVNADQTVIIIWDAANKIQHFIRKASFKSEADDFGFLVPTPAQPELEESGNEAFPYLAKLTEPEIIKRQRPAGGLGCGCSKSKVDGKRAGADLPPANVTVLAQKEVAGFHATVLQATSAKELVKWLNEHGYAFSPEVEAWAKPYVDGGWKITAMKLAKDKEGNSKSVNAAALRMTFKTDQPLFPYREPDTRSAADALKAKNRLLRIYFLAEARYEGELTKEVSWTGKTAWANELNAEQRKNTLNCLKLPDTTGPARWWLTEFEDDWPYQVAPADVYFAPAASQNTLKRQPIIQYVSSPWPADVTVYAIGLAVFLPPLWRRCRYRRG